MAGAMQETFELVDGLQSAAVIRVMGVGGGGSNTVEHMSRASMEGVELYCANTDRKHLEGCSTPNQIQLGAQLTKGLGAGSIADVGRLAAEEDRERIAEILKDTDLLFITAGMGGGTGTGAAPVIAEVAREMKILTVAVVTKPFPAEGKKRMDQATEGIARLAQHVDSLIVIPNEKLRMVLGGSTTLKEAFGKADDVLKNAVLGITDLITRPGLISLDFADVRTVMSARGMAMMGVGRGTGEERAKQAVEMALASPLLDDIEIRGARGLLVNITCDDTLSLDEHEFIMQHVGEVASPDADIKCGTSFDANLNGELRVTVVATGLSGRKPQEEYGPNVKAMPQRRPAPLYGQLPTAPAAAAYAPPSMTPRMPGLTPMADPRTAYGRQQVAVANGGAHWLNELSDEVIDIPAFLRAQAD